MKVVNKELLKCIPSNDKIYFLFTLVACPNIYIAHQTTSKKERINLIPLLIGKELALKYSI